MTNGKRWRFYQKLNFWLIIAVNRIFCHLPLSMSSVVFAVVPSFVCLSRFFRTHASHFRIFFFRCLAFWRVDGALKHANGAEISIRVCRMRSEWIRCQWICMSGVGDIHTHSPLDVPFCMHIMILLFHRFIQPQVNSSVDVTWTHLFARRLFDAETHTYAHTKHCWTFLLVSVRTIHIRTRDNVNVKVRDI